MTLTPDKAARRTAALFYADLDVEIDPSALQAFIKRRWARLAPMAHVMHEAPDDTKQGQMSGQTSWQAGSAPSASPHAEALTTLDAMLRRLGISDFNRRVILHEVEKALATVEADQKKGAK